MHPLHDALRTVSPLLSSPVAQTKPGQWPSDVRSTAQLTANPKTVAAMLEGVARAHQQDAHRYTASALVINLTSVLTGIAIPLILQSDRLPILAPDHARFNMVSGGNPFGGVVLSSTRFYALAADATLPHEDATVVASTSALLQIFGTVLIEHLRPLIASLGTGLKSGERGLWLAAADQLINSTLFICQMLNMPAHAHTIAAGVINVPDSPLQGPSGVEVVHAGPRRGYFVKRAACCFIYMSSYRGQPVQKCLTCPAHGTTRRHDLLQNYLLQAR